MNASVDNPVEPVTVRLLDREFLVACSMEERDGLVAAAASIDARMREMRKSMATPGFERLAVLVALSATHELMQLKQRSEVHEQAQNASIGELRRKLEAVLGSKSEAR